MPWNMWNGETGQYERKADCQEDIFDRLEQFYKERESNAVGDPRHAISREIVQYPPEMLEKFSAEDRRLNGGSELPPDEPGPKKTRFCRFCGEIIPDSAAGQRRYCSDRCVVDMREYRKGKEFESFADWQKEEKARKNAKQRITEGYICGELYAIGENTKLRRRNVCSRECRSLLAQISGKKGGRGNRAKREELAEMEACGY